MKLKLLLVMLTLVFVSCASLSDMFKGDFRKKYCSYEGAYALGVNDARAGDDMRPDVAKKCPGELKQEVRKAYREGYMDTLKIVPQTAKECHRNGNEEICGYNCVVANGRWYCAAHPDEICVEYLGKIRCGRNCRAQFGEIICD